MKTTLPPPSVKKHNPQYDGPPQLENLICKCLEIKPEDRYRTMADIYLELRELARDYNLLDTMERSRAEASGDAPKRPDTETIMKFAQIKNLEPDRKPINKVMVISIIVALAVFALLAASFAMPGILKVEPQPKAMQKPESFSEVDESKIRVRKEPVDKAGSRSQTIEKVETKKPESLSTQSESRKPTASPDTTRSSAKKATAITEPKKRSSASPRARGKLSTRDQEHDTWWDYRLKHEN